MNLFQVTKKQPSGLELKTFTGNPVTFTPTYSEALPAPFNGINLKAEIVASGGNGTPPTPIPIVGHSELNLMRCGINIWDEVTELGGFDVDGSANGRTDVIRSKNYIPCKESTNYYIKQGTLTDSAWSYFVFYDSSKTVIGSRTAVYGSITTPVGAYYMRFQLNTLYGTTYGNNVSINYPSSDTEYHAYNGTPYLVQFGQTVYGGVYDAKTGKLTITNVIIDMGDLPWIKYVTEHTVFASEVDGMKNGGAELLCSCYVYVSGWSGIPNIADLTIEAHPTLNYVYVCDESYSTLEDFITGVTGQKLVYELATPIEIDVSELSVDTIVGVNNIVSDCGGDVTVTCLI